MTVKQAAAKYRIKYETLKRRLEKMTPEDAVKSPLQSQADKGRTTARKIAGGARHQWRA